VCCDVLHVMKMVCVGELGCVSLCWCGLTLCVPPVLCPFYGSSLFVCMTPPLCDSSFHLSSPARFTALDRLALFIFPGMREFREGDVCRVGDGVRGQDMGKTDLTFYHRVDSSLPLSLLNDFSTLLVS